MDTTYVQTLWQIMEELHNADQLEKALSSSLDILRQVTDSNKGSIWMFDSQSERVIALIASNTADAVGESAALGEGIIGEAVKTGEARTFKASEVQHLRFAGADSPEITGKSILAVPIKTPIHTLGCMLLTGKQSGDYTVDDLKICENCCAILALDIDDKGFRFSLQCGKS